MLQPGIDLRFVHIHRKGVQYFFYRRAAHPIFRFTAHFAHDPRLYRGVFQLRASDDRTTFENVKSDPQVIEVYLGRQGKKDETK